MFYRNAQVFFLPSKSYKMPLLSKKQGAMEIINVKKEIVVIWHAHIGSDSEGEDDITMSYDSDE